MGHLSLKNLINWVITCTISGIRWFKVIQDCVTQFCLAYYIRVWHIMKMDIIINTHLAIKIYAILVCYRKKWFYMSPDLSQKCPSNLVKSLLYTNQVDLITVLFFPVYVLLKLIAKSPLAKKGIFIRFLVF